ncbi:MAG: hypothetical protein AB4352_07010 [Hormoscilla sp.]
MNSKELAKYIEANDGIYKPCLLVQLRLKKLQERLDDREYMRELKELHEDLMKLGEWWKGIEEQVF